MTTHPTTKPEYASNQTPHPGWWGLGWLRRLTRPAPPPAPPGTRISYMDRYSLRRQLKSGLNEWVVYLHNFLAPDSDGYHNHSFKWSFSIVLWGSYTEEILYPPMTEYDREMVDNLGLGVTDLVRTRRVRWFNWITADKYHRVTELHPGPGARGVWTLFIVGPLSGRGWGFWVPGKGHVDWETHHANQAKNDRTPA